MENIKLEILRGSYQEHLNADKALSFILPITHWKRMKLNEETNRLIKEIHEITNGQ
jgi:hypothetical protein